MNRGPSLALNTEMHLGAKVCTLARRKLSVYVDTEMEEFGVQFHL